MEQSGIKEILKALELHSHHIDQKLENFQKNIRDEFNSRMDKMEYELNSRMDKMEDELNGRIDKMEDKFENRFERLETKFDWYKVELLETQETVDYLASKNVQHERKLRSIASRPQI